VTRSQTPPKQTAKKLVRLLRAERPDYQYLKKVFQHSRSMLTISPAKVGKRLPELLTDHELVRFTKPFGTRAELARVRLQDVDLDHCKLHVVQGKRSKDLSVLFPSGIRGELGQHIMDRASDRPSSYSNLTDCGRTPPVASDRSSTNTPQPLGSKKGSIRICFGIRSSLF
jgi:hypothetical protein